VGQRPEELKSDIAQRREQMGDTLDAIGDRVSPGQIAGRQKALMRRRVTGWRYSIMGQPDQPSYGYSSGSYASGTDEDQDSPGLTDRIQDRAQAVTDAPQAARRQAQGNPMAAGLIAFGAGLLIATVLPESETEQQAVQQVQPKLEQAASQAGEIGQQVADTAKQSAQEHGQELKGSVTDAAQQVKQEASGAAQEVKDHAQDAAQDVKGEAQAAKDRAGS